MLDFFCDPGLQLNILRVLLYGISDTCIAQGCARGLVRLTRRRGMKRLMHGLLATLVVFGSMSAKVHTNKTFLMPRSHNENLAMEVTGWHKHYRDIDDKKYGGTLQATAFYEESTNESKLGEYFGVYNNASGPNITNPYAKCMMDFIWVKDRPGLSPAAPPTFNNEYALLLDPRRIIHDPAGTVSERLDVKGYIRPKRESYGVVFDFYHDIDKLTDGLYFKASVPVVHVKHDLRMCYTGSRCTQHLPYYDVNGTSAVSLANYLAGSVCTTGTQCPLTHAKICCDDDSTTGVEDVDLTLGYNFLYNEHKHFGVNVALTVPTTSKPNGERLFEAVLGYAGHWALGFGVDWAFELWQHRRRSLEFVGAINYKYVLEATEKRTLGFRYPSFANDIYLLGKKRVPFGHYFLGAEQGIAGTFPLANVLTRDVGVAPGSRVEVLASFAYNHGNWAFDLGYNGFAKEAECICVKCWEDDRYALVTPTYDTTAAFDAGTDSFIYNGLQYGYGPFFINKVDLLPCDAATPTYITHKIFGGVSYSWHGWRYPLLLGIGGSWEFVQSGNAALENYALWLKGGFSF